jgi:hypothetical protein
MEKVPGPSEVSYLGISISPSIKPDENSLDVHQWFEGDINFCQSSCSCCPGSETVGPRPNLTSFYQQIAVRKQRRNRAQENAPRLKAVSDRADPLGNRTKRVVVNANDTA